MLFAFEPGEEETQVAVGPGELCRRTGEDEEDAAAVGAGGDEVALRSGRRRRREKGFPDGPGGEGGRAREVGFVEWGSLESEEIGHLAQVGFPGVVASCGRRFGEGDEGQGDAAKDGVLEEEGVRPGGVFVVSPGSEGVRLELERAGAESGEHEFDAVEAGEGGRQLDGLGRESGEKGRSDSRTGREQEHAE